MNEKKTTNSALVRRCPILGGPVHFGYCKTGGEQQLPCRKIIDCWWETFDIEKYLKDTMKEEDLAKLIDPKPPNKIANILKAAEKSK